MQNPQVSSPPLNPNYSRLTTFVIEGFQAKNITDKDTFIKFSVDGKKFKTKVHKKTQNPSWSDKFNVTTTNKIDVIIFSIISQNMLGADVIGQIKVPIISPNKPKQNQKQDNTPREKENNNGNSKENDNSNNSNNSNNSSNNNNTNNYDDESKVPISTTPTNNENSPIHQQTQQVTTAQISSSPSIPGSGSLNGLSNILNGSNNYDTISSSVSDTGVEIFTIDNWTVVEREKSSSSLAINLSELRVKITVKVRDIYFDTDTNSTASNDETYSNTNTSGNNILPPPKDFKPESVNPKEMSFIGKGGSQILKLTKKIASKMDKGNKQNNENTLDGNGHITPSSSNHGNLSSLANGYQHSPTNPSSSLPPLNHNNSNISTSSQVSSVSNSSPNISNNSNTKNNSSSAAAEEKTRREQHQRLIDEQLAKEQELERIEKEKALAREKLRQLEQEEAHKKIESERREARRKEKEEKKKLDRERKYVPDKPIDYFFVCGVSSTLEPLDQINEQTNSKILTPLEKSYKGELMEFYPLKEVKEILPKHIWMYCFPRGLNISTEIQPPSFFPFVLTNETGTRFYASCLTFYEQLSDQHYNDLQKETNDLLSNQIIANYTTEDNNNNNQINTEENKENKEIENKDIVSPKESINSPELNSVNSKDINDQVQSPTITSSNTPNLATSSATTNTNIVTSPQSPISPSTSNSPLPPQQQSNETTPNVNSDFPSKLYIQKCICVLSHYPFYSSFRIALNEIYHRVFFSSSPIPIERYIFNLVNEVPLPKPGKNPVTFNLGGATNCTLKIPDECLLPDPDISYTMLFLCLDIKNVLSLLKCLLLEEKILLVSSQYTILTYISEIISNIIYPLCYTHIYVPVLPEALVDIAGSTPFPFVMGIHKSYAHRILSKEDLLNELVIVDLDNNTVNIPTDTKNIQLPEKETNQLIAQLRKVVQFEIQSSDLPNFNPNTLCSITMSNDSTKRINQTNNNGTNNNINSGNQQQSNNNRNSVSCYPMQVPQQSNSPDQYIRFSFLQYFCNILHDYRKYYKYLRVFPQPIPIFNNEEYIKSRTINSRPFFSTFIKTQAFIYFLERHSWPTKNLFDYLIQSKRYQKSIEELLMLYQSSIPQALGLQDQSSMQHIQVPFPSSIKGHQNSLREYSRFPTLKAELYGVVQQSSAPSITNSPPSLSSSNTSCSSTLSNDQYKSIYDMYVVNSDPSINSSTTFSFNDDQHKSFVTLIERFLDKIFSDQVPAEDINQIVELLQFDSGRFIFGKLLLGHQKQNFVGSSVSSISLIITSNNNTINAQKARLSDPVFDCLAAIIETTLRQCNTQLDFTSSQMLLEAVFVYHRIVKGQTEYLHEKLGSIGLWQNQKFWEKIFYDSIESRCKILYGCSSQQTSSKNLLHEMVEWSIRNEDSKKEMIRAEEDMAFSLLSNQTFKMITLGSSPDLVRRFVNRMCSSINLDSDTMLQVVSNMTRVRELEQINNGGITPIQESNDLIHRKHIMKNNPEHDKEDSYQLISKHKSGDHNKNNNEIFHNLFDEKGHVSLNKIINMKSSWNENKTKSKSATKVPIKEISENRGDYVVKLFAGHQEGVLCSAVSQRENSLLVTGSADSTLKVWDITTTKCVSTLEDHSGWVSQCEITHDPNKLISGSYDKMIKLWDLHKGQKIKSFRGHKGSITCLSNQDPNIFISGSYDNTINVWDTRSHKPQITLFGHSQSVSCLLVNDQYRVISGSNDTNIRIWDIRTSTAVNVLSGHSDWINCIEVDNTDTLISGSCDGRVKVWSLDNHGECISTLQSHSGSVNSIIIYGKLENDGTTAPKKFLTASSDSTLKVWDSNYVESYHCLEGHTDEVVSVSKFINNFVLSASFDGTVRLWDVDGGKSKRTLHNHSNRISSLKVFDQSFVTTSWDKTAKICQFNLDFRGGISH
ncbi:hypothetical protein DICPUDRAFT_155132 [Dictyostelium purpureum]|uniref:WD40 repeat-containing protein n=1 Tax=Dictyostelium purpureum TaxID=5786 RepID=F0ZT55_DICPU|nr:uncharacterized protein DICPUDRAFT_155132 [Dictyostelium purpureum]EGC32883.1 hypothetical protein DICPUDRAFT_155132 [Dictyostelium purpureum]|eukprot:XP_003290602.1 hypothetical protein DICPUDRAFT_155132 [Dictyostelium purpureum]